MSLTASIFPKTMALCGNPVRLDITSSAPVSYLIKSDGNTIFEGSGEAGTFNVFINEILASILSPTRYSGYETDILLSPSGNLKSYSVELSNTAGETLILTPIAVLGGISKRAMRHLKAGGSNIFTFKLMNSAGNFFMTTRSATRSIEIRETELMPLPFIAPANQIIIQAAVGITKTLTTNIGTCYALNVEALRKAFFNDNNILSNQFDVITADGNAVSIYIIASDTEKERYHLEFLNSYGAYERIEVTGKPSFDQDKTEESAFGVYDIDVDDYVETRERVSSTDILEVETGFKGEDELMFLLDMLSSDDITLIGYEDRAIKVNASAETLAFAKNITEPQQVTLKLRFSDSEKHFTQALLGSDFDDPRIHSEEFSMQFN